MARFFIERPIFAWVISIIIMLGGLLAILVLPVAQYPAIVLPEVRISAVYPGASAATVDSTVTQIIEQNMNGIDNLLYMSATSDSSGRAEIRLTFAAEANHDIAQVQAQNKLQLATPQLPLEVQQQGIAVTKSTSTFLMVIGFYSADGSMTDADIADYVSSSLKDSLARVPGDRTHVLSTGGMLDFARRETSRQVLVATEIGMLHQLRKANPVIDFQPVNPQAACPFMKMTTPEKLEACLGDPALTRAYEVDVPADVAARARRAVERMVAIGNPGSGE